MSKILVTGFEPFATSSLNPSGEIVKALIGDDLVTAILPVVFGQASAQLRELIDLHKPSAVLCLGQAEGRSAMTPERIAINLDNARIADNAGNQPLEQKINADGPDGHFSTLPIEKMVTSMKAAGIDPSKHPVSGQDADTAEAQRILAGEQYMTIFRPLKQAAAFAATAAWDVLNKKPLSKKVYKSTSDNGAWKVPTLIDPAVSITKANLKKVMIDGGYTTAADICTPAYEAACTAAGIKK